MTYKHRDPCRFCGSHNIYVEQIAYDSWAPACADCPTYDSEAEALAARSKPEIDSAVNDQPVDCRKAFETELAKYPAELFRRHRDQFDSDNYGSMYTQAAWQIFQSAWQPERGNE